MTIDWANRTIYVAKVDTTLVQSFPTEIRNMDLNVFRLALKTLETSEEGAQYPNTHSHNGEVLLGGITYARVVEIINGYTVTFEDGQYAVNLIGANSNVGDVINVNQVSIRSANSAGLISSQDIQFSSFGGGVTIDQANKSGRVGVGTVFPAGTYRQPVNSLANLDIISNLIGLSKVFILGNLNIAAGVVFNEHQFVGESAIKTTIYIDPAATITNCQFHDAVVTGALDGNSQIERSVISDLLFVDGFIYDCALGNIQLAAGTTANIFNCYSTVPGISTPEIDMNGTGVLALRNYTGGVLLKNYNGAGSHSIDLASGQIKLDSTITSGTFVVRGVGKLIDTSGNPIYSGTWNGGVTIVNELVNSKAIAKEFLDTNLPRP